MSDEPRWVPRLAVEAAQLDQLREHGGALGVRDAVALDLALDRARQRWRDVPGTDLPELAATYAFEICTRRPFRAGNQRIAFLAAGIFLALNGRDLAAPNEEVVAQMTALASEVSERETLGDWLRQRSCAGPDSERSAQQK